MSGTSFQLIKLDDAIFGIKIGEDLKIGTWIEVGGYAIDKLKAEPKAIYEVLTEFNHTNSNYADFGIFGTWTFICNKNVNEYLQLTYNN